MGTGGPSRTKISEADDARTRMEHVCTQISRAAAALAAVLAGLGLVGWAVGSPFLKGFSPAFPALAPNTSIALLLLAAALLERVRPEARGARRTFGRLAAGIAGLVGLATLLEFAIGTELGIDRLLVPSGACGDDAMCGRPSSNAALALVLASAALLTLDVRGSRLRHPAHVLAALVGATSLAAIAGYLYGAPPLYRIPGNATATGLSVHAAVALTSLAVGIFCARPQAGLMHVVLSPHAGGTIARRFLVAAFAAPLLGLVFLLGAGAGLYSEDMSEALLAVTVMVLAIAWVLRTARVLDETDRALRAVEIRHRTFVERCSDPILLADMTGRFVDANRSAVEQLGFTRGELLGMALSDLVTDEELAELAEVRERLLAGGVERDEWDLVTKDGHVLAAELTATITPEGQWQLIARDLRARPPTESAAGSPSR